MGLPFATLPNPPLASPGRGTEVIAYPIFVLPNHYVLSSPPSWEASMYTQTDTDPVCRSNPPLAPPKRGTGVILYSVLSSQIILLFQVPPLGRGGGFSTLLSCISTCVHTIAPEARDSHQAMQFRFPLSCLRLTLWHPLCC